MVLNSVTSEADQCYRDFSKNKNIKTSLRCWSNNREELTQHREREGGRIFE